MRMNHTPPAWQPSPAMRRFKEFSYLGLPWTTSILTLVSLAAVGAVVLHEIPRVQSKHNHMDWGAFWVGAGALAFGAFMAYLAFARVFKEADGFLEIDPAQRRLLAVCRLGLAGLRRTIDPATQRLTPNDAVILSFDEITAFAFVAQQSSTTYVSRATQNALYTEVKRIDSLVALPQGISIFRDRGGASVRGVAEEVAALAGKPLIDIPQAGAAPLPPGMSIGMRISVVVPGRSQEIGNVAAVQNGQVQVMLRTGERVWVPLHAVSPA